MDDGGRREATEQWFIRRGVPHFIDGYSATRDIFTRAAWLLTLIALAEVLSALTFDTVWANALAALGGLGLVIGGWALVNRWRGRPALSSPTSVGLVELAVFVLLPALVPVVFGGNLSTAAALAAANLVLLGVIYVGTSYGIVPIVRWAVVRVARTVGITLLLFAKALPLLLLFVTFLFINAEVWQVAADLTGPSFVATLGLFAGLATLFLVVRLPREVAGLGTFPDWSDVAAACIATPMEGLLTRSSGPPPERPLSRRQWANVGLMVLFGQAVQVVLVAALVGAFLVGLGLLAIPESVIVAWTQDPQVVAVGPSLPLFGRNLQLTQELLRVASFLAAFSGLYFAVSAVIDTSYREEFFEPVVGEVRQSFGVRLAYLETSHEIAVM